MQQVKQLALDIIGLLFPNLCNACGMHLYGGEKVICLHCLHELPFTDFHLHQDNLVAKQLWARLPFEAAMAMLYFKKGTKTQQLIHNLKYNGQIAVGVTLGNLLANKLIESPYYQAIDYIIPVPLHQKKERLRGYNQSLYIANGIAEQMNVPVSKNQLIRKRITDTQTKKSRYSRYENMLTVFEIVDPTILKNKHILLIDDVITTGSTIEACGNSLLKCGVNKLSIASVAFAQ